MNSQVLTFNRKTVKTVITELMHWDSCFTRGNCYSSLIKQNADWMQIIYILTGFKTNLRKYKNDNPSSIINYQLDVTERDYSLTTNIKKSFKEYDGKVYCVSVPSSFIVVRRNEKVCITGNCPRKDNDPIGVRNFFIAPKSKVLMSLDFSQIELRVGAFYCRDEAMMETYKSGGYIHAKTTSVIYKIPFEQAVDKNAPHYKERKTIAKACNFGVFFGLFARGLLRSLKFKAELNKTLKKCEEIIKNLKAGYPQIETWKRKVKVTEKFNEYPETYLVRILRGLPERPWLRPLLQIHDELIFELPEEKLDEAIEFVKECMETQLFEDFDIPLVAEAAVGTIFGSLKEMEV